ncbi:hypothetical protein EIP91_003660, partial [Steccherinum ochraceum]
MRFTAVSSLTILSLLLASSSTAWVLPGYDRVLKSLTLQSSNADALFATSTTQDEENATGDADARVFIHCQNQGNLVLRRWADEG